MKVRKDIIEACKIGKLIPFVGAGFSCNISPDVAYPSIVNEMIRRELDTTDSDGVIGAFQSDYPRINDFLIHIMGNRGGRATEEIINYGRTAFCTFVRNVLETKLGKVDATSENNWVQHLHLSRSFQTIFTTNWDETIERAAEYKNEEKWEEKEYQIIWLCNGKRKRRPDNDRKDYDLFIVKYHGHIEDVQSLAVGEEDCYTRLRTRDPMDYYLGTRLGNKGLLFLGYSLTDMNVRYTLHQINAVRRVFNEEFPSYLIMIDDFNNDLRRRIAEHMRDQWNIILYWPIEWESDDFKHCRPQIINLMRRESNNCKQIGKYEEATDIDNQIKRLEKQRYCAEKSAIGSLMEDIYNAAKTA